MRCNWVYNGIESLQLVGGLKCFWMCGVFLIFDGFLAYLMVSFVMGVCIQVSFDFEREPCLGNPHLTHLSLVVDMNHQTW